MSYPQMCLLSSFLLHPNEDHHKYHFRVETHERGHHQDRQTLESLREPEYKSSFEYQQMWMAIQQNLKAKRHSNTVAINNSTNSTNSTTSDTN